MVDFLSGVFAGEGELLGAGAGGEEELRVLEIEEEVVDEGLRRRGVSSLGAGAAVDGAPDEGGGAILSSWDSIVDVIDMRAARQALRGGCAAAYIRIANEALNMRLSLRACVRVTQSHSLRTRFTRAT